MEKKSKNILRIFSENEAKVEKLYRLCAARFPRNEKMWLRLANEEAGHAKAMVELKRGAGRAEKMETDGYLSGAIKYVGDFIDEQFKKISSGRLELAGAVEAALRIERSMTEKKYFETFKLKDGPAKNVFKKLNNQTDQHIKILEKALKKCPGD